MKEKFILRANYNPAGDQPKAIKELVDGINQNKEHQVLLGVTGSGKTFTIANVIAQINRPALILSHNKTLASQLYSELRDFFPENRVEYFVSYFDYYQPEAYLPNKDLYIEKNSQNNKKLAAMRMSAINALSIRRDTIVVASVAAIYGEYNPNEYRANFFPIEIGMKISHRDLLNQIHSIGYERNRMDLQRGQFDNKGDIFEIAPGYTDEYNIRIECFDDEIERITIIDPLTKEVQEIKKSLTLFPATTYMIKKQYIENMVEDVKEELKERVQYFLTEQKLLEAERIQLRTLNDLDNIQEFGFTSGIENYARYLDGRKPGERPYTLFDYLPKDTVIFIDESHKTIDQIYGMYKGDYERKKNLVDYGYRLPSALDNRPLKFEEYEEFPFQRIYLSATPKKYEINKTDGEITTLIIRPTGLLDPIIEVRNKDNQIQDAMLQIKKQVEKNERTLILTRTIDMAATLNTFLRENNIKSAHVDHNFKTLDRNEILRALRKGTYDVVIGIGLLREGIDLPEVSLICVLDADVKGLSRDKESLIQIVGRAARNDHGKVIFYANTITEAMQATIDDNELKRKIQMEHNKKHNIIPKTIIKPIPPSLYSEEALEKLGMQFNIDDLSNIKHNKKLIDGLIKQMKKASKERKYEEAIEIRDYLIELGINLDE
ncbi:excinuclease ABC subunit UvrB [[Mycoplasma] anseris]|uniref:UvrABC system protein B n=1 Tax=[Mycoplasma] anseris TaxID=92400 RepID=A0A2Z4NCS9_9BACT|nr:excinuclease ABC subunit UvrB [[Mycoplasma] anseris]AWX69362.1 excinuclease ABC subunit UvrB [[Mycoplasma] anseris]